VTRGVDFAYTYPTGNNRRISQMTDNISGEQVSNTYDQLNRLVQSASSVTGHSMTFGYDGFGNLTQQGQTFLSIDPNTNRINSAGYQYNANGNVTQTPDLATYTYDVANRLVSNNAIYNPRNQRVFDETYLYLYTPEGKLAGKYTPQWSALGSRAIIQGNQPNVYFGGKLIQEQGQWVMTDRLGSVRLRASGERSSYQPYGAEVAPATSDQRTKFATYYRDSAGLDYAGQRYYSNVTGRFLTPDPGGIKTADPKNPGSWNRYAYVYGDPINFNDPQGLFGCMVSGIPCDFYANWLNLVCPPGVSGCVIGSNENSPADPPAPKVLKVKNLSTTSAQATGVQNSLRWLQVAISQDDTCNSWLKDNQGDISWMLGGAPGSTMAVGVGNFSGPGASTTNAVAGNSGTDLPDGMLITVNLNGAFFYSNSIAGYGTNIQGGTDAAKALILLHELAHITEAQGFINDDGGANNEAAQTRNNQLVLENCGGVVGRAAGGQ
jgi:RHS repeat-associated protein